MLSPRRIAEVTRRSTPSRTSRCCAGTRACRRGARSASRRRWSRRCAHRRKTVLRRAARQPSARADRRRARRLRAPRSTPASPWSARPCCSRASTTMPRRWRRSCARFVETRVKPYYLHHVDLAPGTAHFRTTIAEGQALMRALRGRLSGPRAADLRARHPRRPRQGADRARTICARPTPARYAIEDRADGSHVYEDACAAPVHARSVD